MGRARLPFTKKFQPKFSVFGCANTHSTTKTKSHKRKQEKLLFLALVQSKEFSSYLFENIYIHTSYLSFFLHMQNFWRIKFTPKNA